MSENGVPEAHGHCAPTGFIGWRVHASGSISRVGFYLQCRNFRLLLLAFFSVWCEQLSNLPGPWFGILRHGFVGISGLNELLATVAVHPIKHRVDP